MPASDIQRLGLPCSDSAAAQYVLDSGVTALGTGATSTTATVTAPQNIDGTYPVIRQGWLMVEISGLTGAYISSVDVSIDDGTVTIAGPSMPGAAAHTVGRGLNWLVPLFATLSDSMASTGIKDVNVVMTFSANPTGGNYRVVFSSAN